MDPILFISHASQDRDHGLALVRHLSTVLSHMGYSAWHRGMIDVGENEEETARVMLEAAAACVLLVSADYLDSNSCQEEVRIARRRANEDGIRLFPVLARACVTVGSPIERLQCLPSNGTAVASWNNQDEAWADVARGIAEVLAPLPPAPKRQVDSVPASKPVIAPKSFVERPPANKPVVRVALAQLDYHPALFAARRCPLEDPGGINSLLPGSAELLPEHRRRFEKLRARVRDAYCRQALARLQAIVRSCRSWEVQILVLPEYSVPWELLVPLAHACGPMVVVAGSHRVEREALLGELYSELGCPDEDLPAVGQAVAPVLHNRRILGLVPKVYVPPAREEEIEPGIRWRPIPMPEGIPGPMGILTCHDLLQLGNPAVHALVSDDLTKCQFLSVLSRTRADQAREVHAKAWDESRRFSRPVLFADHATAGGTAVFAGEAGPRDVVPPPARTCGLRPNEEGVIVADVELSADRSRGSRGAEEASPIRSQTVASLLYSARPLEKEYYEWRSALGDIMEMHVADRLGAALEHAKRHTRLLESVRDAGGASRRERLDLLLLEHGRHVTNMDRLEELVAEVVLPMNVLPFDQLRAAHLKGCEEAVMRWLAKTPSMTRAVVSLLEEALQAKVETLVDEGGKAFEQEKELVRGTPKERAQAEEYCGRDSIRARNGVSLTLRRHVSEFEPSFSPGMAAHFLGEKVEDEPLPRSRHSRPNAGIDFWSMEIPFAYTQQMVLFWELLCAEGNEPVAAVAVCNVVFTDSWGRSSNLGPSLSASGIKLFLLCRRGENLTLTTFEPEIRARKAPEGEEEDANLFWRFAENHRDPLIDAFEEWGMDLADIEVVSNDLFSRRFHAVLTRFDGARTVVERLRQHRLASVEGHFVEPSLAKMEYVHSEDGDRRERVVRSATEALSHWLRGRRADWSSRQAALVLGEYGSGKSTLLAEWASHLWRAEEGPRPLLVDLATRSAGSPDALLLDAAELPDTPQNRAALRMGIRSGRLLPIFDGFDEMATRVAVGELSQRLADLLDSAQLEGLIVLSSRDHYFPTEGELNRAFERALKASLKGPANAERLTLCLFSHEQIQALVRRVTSDEGEAALLWKRICETYDLEELCERPLLLSMVISSRHEILHQADFRRADLYDACLRRWLAQAGGVEREIFSNDQKRLLAETIAQETWRSAGEGASLETLRGLLHRSFPAPFFDDVPRTAEVLETTGGMFLVREPTVFGDRFRFAHKSFLEYFLASALLRASETGVDALVEALSTRPLTNEVMDFLEELLARQGAVRKSAFVMNVSGWLLARGADSKRPFPSTAEAASNAVHLLVRLARRNGVSGGWLPRRADLRDTRLSGVDLRGVHLRECDLAGADLSSADLRDADLTGACLQGAILTLARLDGTILAGVRAGGADFRMISAEGANLTGADFRSAILQQSSWVACTWDDADTEGADGFAWVVKDTEWPDGLRGIGPWQPGDARLEPAIDPDATPFGTKVAMGAWLSGGRSVGALTVDGSWRVWDVASGKRLFDTGDSAFRTAAPCSAGTSVAFVDERRDIQIWTTYRPWELRSISGPSRSVCLSHDGEWIAVEDPEGNIRVVDARSGETIVAQDRRGEEVVWMSFSPDSAWLVAFCRGGLALLLSLREESVSLPQVEKDQYLVVAWCPGEECTLAVSAGDFLIRFIDMRSGDELSPLLLTQKGYSQLAFSPSGRFLAAVDEAGRVHVWDMSDRAEIGMFEQHPLPMMNPPPPAPCAWSPDETKIATFGPDVRIWDWRKARVFSRLPRPSNVEGHLGPWGNGLLCWSADSRRLVWRGLRFEGAVVVDFEVGQVSLWPLSELPGLEIGADAEGRGGKEEDAWFQPLIAAATSVHRCSVVGGVPNPPCSMVATLGMDGGLAIWDVAELELLCTISALGHTVLVRNSEGRCIFLSGPEEEQRLVAVATSGSLVRVYAPGGGLLRSFADASRVAACLKPENTERTPCPS